MPSNFLQIYCGLSVWHLWSPWNSVQVSVQELEEFLKTAWRATGQLDGASSSHLQGSPSQGWFLSPKKNESESGEWKSWLKAQHSKNKDHGIRSHHFMANRWRNSGNSSRLYYFFWLQNHCRWWLQPWNLKTLLGRKVTTNLDSILKSRVITLPTKGPSSQGYGFSSGHVWMWELDCEDSWAPKNWCFWTVVLEKTLESPLDCKEI